jgi:hypothetical protein
LQNAVGCMSGCVLTQLDPDLTLPAGLCIALIAAYGRHAEAVAARLHAGGLSCKVLDRSAFTRAMLEKLVWIRCVDNIILKLQRQEVA